MKTGRDGTEEQNEETRAHSGIWDKDGTLCMAEFQFKQMWKESLEAKYFCGWDDTQAWNRQEWQPHSGPRFGLSTRKAFNMAETENEQNRFLNAALHAFIIEEICARLSQNVILPLFQFLIIFLVI